MQFFKWYLNLGVILFTLLLSSTVSATIITEDLFGEVLVGSLAGETGTGTFSYDDELIAGIGFETLVTDEFNLEFTIFSKTFTNVDDFAYPETPELIFFDGLAIELDFLVFQGIPVAGVNDFTIFDLLPSSSTGFYTEVTVNTVVPLPLSFWLFGSGLLGLVGHARKKS